jgi:hypothetical protein
VVFTSSNTEDVPFDLRHSRVIIYDIREPEWATRLRKSIADYLRNAMKEPGKSTPIPSEDFLNKNRKKPHRHPGHVTANSARIRSFASE